VSKFVTFVPGLSGKKGMTDRRFIGVFDSGLGGLSVLRSLLESLPGESFRYFADSAWCPYGNRSSEEIQVRADAITKHFLGMGAKMVVVACNTATAEAIDHLRSHYDIPFVGIEPAIRQAAVHTASGKVGVLATRNTIRGRLFRETSARYAADKDIMIQVGEGLVELVEEGLSDTPETTELLRRYIVPMLEAGVDQIVLGCTHYPFLIPAIRRMTPPNVVIHDPSPAIARQAAHVLKANSLEASPGTPVQHAAETSGSPDRLEEMIRTLNLNFFDVRKVNL
jgi:glutamate racemase